MNYLDCAGEFEGEASKPQNGWIAMSKSGSQSVRILLTVTGDDVDAGKSIFCDLWLTEKAFTKTVRRLVEVFNFDGDFDKLAAGDKAFDGMPCRFTVEMEEYQGEQRAKVKWLNNINWISKKQAPAELGELKALANSFTRKAKAIVLEAKAEAKATGSSETAKPSPADKKPGDPAKPDDDIPF
jgi:hypothetical protein